MKRLLTGALAAGLLWTLAGCATTTKRQELMASTTDHLIYRLPAERVMQAVHDVVGERGYVQLPSNDPNYLRTQWKIDGNLDIGASWSAYLVQVHRMTNGQVAVRAYRVSYTTTGRAAAHPGFAAGQSDQRGRKGAEKGVSDGFYVQGEPLSPTKPYVRRSPELEWAILEKLSPRMAVLMKAQVDQYLAEQTEPPEVQE